jgi:hypothetical protein
VGKVNQFLSKMAFRRHFLTFLRLTLTLTGAAYFFCNTHAFEAHFGPAYDKYHLTLTPGERTEALGPFFGYEKTTNGQSLFRFSPLFSFYGDTNIPQTEFEIAYPLISYDRFGPEYRFQIIQLFSISNAEKLKTGSNKKRFTIFPFYFQQRSPDPEENYTAFIPFYGRLKNRLFRDEIYFILLPIYLETRKGEMVTDNYIAPFFHSRHGGGVNGWQFWPLIGTEGKVLTQRTNHWGDVEPVGGHEKFFLLWPFYFKNTLGIGTTNVQDQFVLLPFYTSQTSPARTSKSYGFPIGVTHSIDREKNYEEWGVPWPLIDFARGEGKTAKRVWPFYSRAKTPILESDFYLWPVYKYNRATADPLDRERTRILLYLYSDLSEKNTALGTRLHRIDLWPFFTWRKDHQNNERLQLLAIVEPFLPGNKSVERLYSPIYAFWRAEKNAKTGATSKSFLWNLYRSEQTADHNEQSALFGLFQRDRTKEKTKWRICFVPFSTSRAQQR